MSLRELPAPLRALFSSFLLLIGIGYLMALSYLYLVDVESHQQMRMGLISGIAMKYHGTAGGTRLEAALRGVMADKIDPSDRENVLRWLQSGAAQTPRSPTRADAERARILAANNRRHDAAAASLQRARPGLATSQRWRAAMWSCPHHFAPAVR